MIRFNAKYTDRSYIIADDSRSSISLPPGKGLYRGENKTRQKITVYAVDGEMIADNNCVKCDYAFYTDSTDNLYLIEIKGSDYPHACEQITSTINILIQSDVAVNGIYCRVVLSNGHKVTSDAEIALKMKLEKLKKDNVLSCWDIQKKSRQLSEIIQ